MSYAYARCTSTDNSVQQSTESRKLTDMNMTNQAYKINVSVHNSTIKRERERESEREKVDLLGRYLKLKNKGRTVVPTNPEKRNML